jgi:hypothetical protein
MGADPRRRNEHDIGAAYAIEFLSYLIEAFCLPGEDAAFVYDMTSYYISQNGDAARGTTVEPGEDEPDSSAFDMAASALRGAMGQSVRLRRTGLCAG